MPLASLNLFAAIVPTFPSHLGPFYRLAIDADGTVSRLAHIFFGWSLWGVFPNLLTQTVDNLLPDAMITVLGEIIIDRAFGEQIMGQESPLATGAILVTQ